MRFLKTIWALAAMAVAAVKWMHATVIAPEKGGEQLPPIRYDGDPTDIYLA